MCAATSQDPGLPSAPRRNAASSVARAAPPNASVIVCTYNRVESLARTLDCLARQDVLPSTRWEVVVVDNNSSDNTGRVVEEARSRWPILRYEFEPQQGLSHARNRGICAARGEILLFTDDDVCPEPSWVRCILERMAEHRCDACGGYIAPDWEVPPPTWLTERFYGFLALRLEDTPAYRVTSVSDAPFGANMAFRREVFCSVGLFDVSRGRKGNVLAGGEEIELFERLLTKGGKVMFFGDARVHHRIESFRATKRYLRRWRFQASRNIAETRGMPGRRRVLGVPLYLLPQLGRACRNALIATLTRPSDEAFYREMLVWHFLGLISGLVSSRGAAARSAAAGAATEFKE